MPCSCASKQKTQLLSPDALWVWRKKQRLSLSGESFEAAFVLSPGLSPERQACQARVKSIQASQFGGEDELGLCSLGVHLQTCCEDPSPRTNYQPLKTSLKESKPCSWKLNGGILDNERRLSFSLFFFFRFRNSVLWFSVMLCAFIDQGARILGSMLLFAFLIPTP